MPPRDCSAWAAIYMKGRKLPMFANETFVAMLRELPVFAEIVVRFFYDLAMHTIGLLGAL